MAKYKNKATGNKMDVLSITDKTTQNDVKDFVEGLGDHFNTHFVAGAMGIALRTEGGKSQTGHPGEDIVRSVDADKKVSYAIVADAEVQSEDEQDAD